MLGNPDASPVVAPLPFILYASGANRGFLLDQSSASVLTGTMSPQGATNGSLLSSSELPGTYAAATTSSATADATPIAANLLATSPGGGVFNITGTQYPGPQTVTGLYTVESTGRGSFTLTAPSAETYALYVVDTTGCTKNAGLVCTIEDFYMIDETATNPNPSVIFAKQ